MGYSGTESERAVEAVGNRPAYRWEEVTPADSGDIGPCRCLRCDSAGYLRIINEHGDDVTLTVAAGEYVPVQGGSIIVHSDTSATVHRLW